MKKESIRAIGIEELKELPYTTLYTDSNIAILSNSGYFTHRKEKEAKLNCLMIFF